MNTIRISTIGIALVYLAFMLSSCGGGSKEHDHGDGEHTHEHGDGEHAHEHGDGDEHKHVYTCPMKCEGSQSDKPGDCPVCGMHLEHSDEALDATKYHITYKSNPDTISAGVPAILSYTPTKDDDESALVPLDIHHEKKLHLMVVSTDLDYFEHVHPEYNGKDYLITVIGKDEEFTKKRGLNETEFVEGGDYIMYLDYVPSGGSGQHDEIRLSVDGTARKNVPLGDQRLVWEDAGYKVVLSADKDFTMNTSIELKVHIEKDGKPLTNLDKYLGALAHMVVISEDTEQCLHVHPMDSPTNGPDVLLRTSFPKAAKYKVFMQFNHDGVVRTTNYVVDVK